MPTTARRVPRAATRSGSLPAAGREPAGGASRSAAPAAGEIFAGRLLRASHLSRPVRWAARSGAVSTRSRAGYGNTAKIAARVARSRSDRRASGTVTGAAVSPACLPGVSSGCSVHPRAASISWSYWTPDGQAVMQAMQPRHRSKCVAAAWVSGAPSRTCVTRWIRPRGESISSPHSWYVGHVGRQKPQCTQSLATSLSRSVGGCSVMRETFQVPAGGRDRTGP